MSELGCCLNSDVLDGWDAWDTFTSHLNPHPSCRLIKLDGWDAWDTFTSHLNPTNP
jgi:hypothetical protein